MSSKKQAAAKQAQSVEVVVQTRWTVPESLKKVPYKEWPEEARKGYLAQHKADNEARKAKLEEKWSKLLGLLDGEALELAKSIHDGGGKAKLNPAKELFGKDPEVGDKVPFELSKVKLINKVLEKGYVLDTVNNEVVLKALPPEKAE